MSLLHMIEETIRSKGAAINEDASLLDILAELIAYDRLKEERTSSEKEPK